MTERKPTILFHWHQKPVDVGSPLTFGFHVLFEPRDLWFGIYWNTRHDCLVSVLDVFVCLVPMFPVRLIFYNLTPRKG